MRAAVRDLESEVPTDDDGRIDPMKQSGVDMRTGERLIPWDPMPQARNTYMEVGVCHVQEYPSVEGTPLEFVLAAARRDVAADGTWRLLFQHVTAYRRETIEAHASAQLIALRDACQSRALPTPATYEVVRSRWLQEAVSQHYAHTRAVRHFVIASSYLAYDIAAEWCDVRTLDGPEQARLDRQPLA